MGNACCCDCVPKRHRQHSDAQHGGYPPGRGRGYPSGRSPDYGGNTNRTNQPIRSGSLLGGKSGNRIYSRYGKYGRNGSSPGGRVSNLTSTSSPVGKDGGGRGGESGIDNLGVEYHENIPSSQRYTTVAPDNPPPVRRMRRKQLGVAKFASRPKNARLTTGNGGPRSPGNIRLENSSYAMDSGYANSGYDSDLEEAQDIQPMGSRSGGVRVNVISVEDVPKNGPEGRREGVDRSYSVATTVLAGDIEDRKATPQRVLVSVKVDEQRWVVHRTAADFRALERALTRLGNFSPPSSPLRAADPLTALDFNNFLRVVLQDTVLMELPAVKEFLELGRIRSFAATDSSKASTLSEDSRNTNNTTGTTSSSNSNTSTDSSNANTLSASIRHSGTNINISLAYKEGVGEIYAETAPFSNNDSDSDDDDPNDINLCNTNYNNNINHLNNIPCKIDDFANNNNYTSTGSLESKMPVNKAGLTDDETHSMASHVPSRRLSTPNFISSPPHSIQGSKPSSPVPHLPISATPPPIPPQLLQAMRVSAAKPPPSLPGEARSSVSLHRSFLTPDGAGERRMDTPINPGLLKHSGVAEHLRRRHSSINLDNLSGPHLQMSPDDFHFLGVIGKGSFGQVLLARHKATSRPFAVKMLSKRMIARRKETQHVLSERSVLIKVLNHPYLVQLHYAFTTSNSIFLVLDYVNGGELFFHLQRERVFSEPRAMFYAAEICCALSYMHTKGIVYRDLKPENLLLDKEGHVVLTDFGLCKEGLQTSSSRTGTFCGTPEYLAPEILLKKPYTRVVDWWTLGAVLYEMLYGLPPFYSKNQMQMYEAIINKPLKLRQTSTHRARSILTALLKKVPEERLGSGPEDGEAVKGHEFFRPVDWNQVEQRKMKPPFVPKVTGDTDTRNIDPSFTKEPVQLGSMTASSGGSRVGTGALSSSGSLHLVDNSFHGFNYVRPATDDEGSEMPER